MGVQGLWQLLQSTGRPVTLESLEGKVLAVDVSIWLNQLVKGMRDRHGNPVPNAHLVGLFNRVCKLLFYRIKPVFVFDGGVPVLKKQTLASRKQRKEQAAEVSQKATQKILTNLIRQQAIKTSLNPEAADPSVSSSNTSSVSSSQKSGRDEDMFVLAPLPTPQHQSDEDIDDVEFLDDTVNEQNRIYNEYQDLGNVDIDSEEFQSLPAEIRHEILTEMKDQRKQNHWANLEDLPEDSDDFSNYQVAKLLKQSKLSVKLDHVRKEINKRHTGTIATDLTGQSTDQVEINRIVSEDSAHYILIKGLSQYRDAVKQRQNQDVMDLTQLDNESGTEVKSFSEESRSSTSGVSHRDDSHISATKNNEVNNAENEPCPSTSTNIEVINATSKSLLSVSENNEVCREGEPKPSTSKINDAMISNIEPQPSTSTDTRYLDSSDRPLVISSSDEEDNVDLTVQVQDMKTQLSKKKDEIVDLTYSEHNQFKSFIEQSSNSPIELDSGSELQLGDDADQKSGLIGIETEQKGRLIKKGGSENSAKNETAKIKSVKYVDNVMDIDLTKTGVICSDKEEKGGIVSEQKRDVQIVSNMESEKAVSDIYGNYGNREKMESDIHTMKTIDSSKAVHRVTYVTVEESSEESEDSDFIEITLDPNNIKPDDELFPASMFTSAQAGQSAEEVKVQTVVPPGGESEQVSITNNIDEMEETEEDEIKQTRAVEQNEFSGLTQAELSDMQADLQQQNKQLEQERGRQERMAATITDQMHNEAQELLSLFGIPYVVSPMEAEAQCAFLDDTDQVEGTITDDSDIWLFGGKKVYKNFFNQNKDLEFFKFEDVKKKLGLNRSKLINIALLCGSDYTSGIQGVGPISALEIMAEFKGDGVDSLMKFRDWWHTAQEQIKIPQETKVKSKLRRLQINSGFPNAAVVEAYMQPCVDESRDTFSWGKPDVDSIRQYASDKFGWAKTKTDEHIVPVMKKLEAGEHQLRITNYFLTQPGEQRNVKSKRLQRALNNLHQEGSPSSRPGTIEEKKAQAKSVLDRANNKAEDVLNVPQNKTVKKRGRKGKKAQAAAGYKRASLLELPKEVNLSESSSSESEDSDSHCDSVTRSKGCGRVRENMRSAKADVKDATKVSPNKRAKSTAGEANTSTKAQKRKKKT